MQEEPESLQLRLAPGRERALLRRHPWVFSGAVADEPLGAPAGATVQVCASDGRALGVAAYSPRSRIRARIWSFEPSCDIDAGFFVARMHRALALRLAACPELARDRHAALRLVNAESDGLPGVTLDRYAGQLVLATTSAGARRHASLIAQAAAEVFEVDAVYERSEGEVLELEGLDACSLAWSGPVPQAPIEFFEHGARFAVDVVGGHKTGFYLDQRDNRARAAALARDREVLDCFSYSGAFAVHAALGGARSVLAVDSSKSALERARENTRENGVDDRVELIEDDVFRFLRRARDAARRFDLVVLDPPKLAPSARLAERAARAYKDINLLAFKLLRPGGLLLTFSCSGGMSRELFDKVVAGAAADASTEASVLARLGPGVDHPFGLHFPEGEYLKGLLLQRH